MVRMQRSVVCLMMHGEHNSITNLTAPFQGYMWPALSRAAVIAYRGLAHHVVTYRHNLESPMRYFPTGPFVISIVEIAPTTRGRRILVIQRVDNNGIWEDGSTGKLPVLASNLHFVEDMESP